MVYLDNNSTTAVDSIVLENMAKVQGDLYGNPSSLHASGQAASTLMSNARKTLANILGCEPDEIIFTSSGTEANNLAIKGYTLANKHRGNHIITSAIEHPSVTNVCAYLGQQGFDVTYLKVDSEGFVSAADLLNAITDSTILVTIGAVNGEIGTIQD